MHESISIIISIFIYEFFTGSGFGFEAFGCEIFVEDNLLLLPNKFERALMSPAPPPQLFLDFFIDEPIDNLSEPLNSHASLAELLSSQAIAALYLYLEEL